MLPVSRIPEEVDAAPETDWFSTELLPVMSSKSHLSGRRQHRLPLSIAVILISQSKERWPAQPGETIDVAEQGARVKTRAEVRVGQTLELVPKDGARGRARGRVVWAKKAGKLQETEFGVEFLDCLRKDFWIPREPEAA